MIFYKVFSILIICTTLVLVWHTSFAVETFREGQVVKGEVLELFLSGDLNANFNIANFKHSYCTDKEILLHSYDAKPFNIKLSFQRDLSSQGWNYYSLNPAQPLRLDIFTPEEKASFYALEGNLDLHKNEGYFDAYMLGNKDQRIFLSGYFRC